MRRRKETKWLTVGGEEPERADSRWRGYGAGNLHVPFSHHFHVEKVLCSRHANEQSTQGQNRKEIQLNLPKMRLERSPNAAKNGQAHPLY